MKTNVTVNLKVLTEPKKIGENFHSTAVTDAGRIVRTILPTNNLKKNNFFKFLNARYMEGIDVDYIRPETDTKVSLKKVDFGIVCCCHNAACLPFFSCKNVPCKKTLNSHQHFF